MDEQAVLRLARRRRLGRRLGLASVPVGLVVVFVVASWDDGAPDLLSLAVLLLLAGVVGGSWWWLEHSAGTSVAEFHRPRRDAGPFTSTELDDARAELALRTCSPPPPGGRARAEGLADRWSRDARSGLWLAPLYAAVAVLTAMRTGIDEQHAIPWPLVLLWAVMAAALLTMSARRWWLARRWSAAHGVAREVAGRS